MQDRFLSLSSFFYLSFNAEAAGGFASRRFGQPVDKVIFAKKTTSKMFQMQLLC
jgi:hypothetical protein